MPAGTRSKARPSAGGEHARLEQRLVLLAWLNGHFGYVHNRDLLADVKDAGEGFDASGRSCVHHRLAAHGGKVQIPPADLACYDENIREHLRAMSARNRRPLGLPAGTPAFVFMVGIARSGSRAKSSSSRGRWRWAMVCWVAGRR